MIEFGRINRLTVVEVIDNGVTVDGGKLGRLFLPKSELKRPVPLGESLDLFVYTDPVKGTTITTQKPLAQAGDFALMRVVGVTEAGAFLDWGLTKDLFVPARAQQEEMLLHQSYMVHLFNDRGNRTVASSRLDSFLDQTSPPYKDGDKVDLVIDDHTDLGFKAIVDNAFWGVLYENEVFQTLKYGQQTQGYIKKVREDGKLDLSLQPTGIKAAVSLADEILVQLEKADGFLPLTDKSTPEEIQRHFATSKKKFKMALGTLYKQRLITLESDGIRLAKG